MNDSAPQRRWPQFKRNDFILGATLVALGIALLAAGERNLFHLDWHEEISHLTLYWLLYASGALIGAGLLSPFRLKTVGMILGFVLIFPAIVWWELLFA